jgi:hypothetical protein
MKSFTSFFVIEEEAFSYHSRVVSTVRCDHSFASRLIEMETIKFLVLVIVLVVVVVDFVVDVLVDVFEDVLN